MKNVEIAEKIVSILNYAVEVYCKKYPEQYEFDEESFAYNNVGKILTANGDDLGEALDWVFEEVMPDLITDMEDMER